MCAVTRHVLGFLAIFCRLCRISDVLITQDFNILQNIFINQRADLQGNTRSQTHSLELIIFESLADLLHKNMT